MKDLTGQAKVDSEIETDGDRATCTGGERLDDESKPDGAEFALEDFNLDDIEVIESKVFA
ncbi:TglA family RiPP precursor [Burkholderia sp. SCN-KJ]|uniref:TglA family RiPP precursor n=1 Tax=Burkholderia sp. SCN-KJ TaxID=2969248 RepID=UPI0021501092|nr:TglA family RiPP precursor [Burkholderia sp. SCN-KJ]MCR4471352.1 TglA family RiPP precursor [Burkholderia sp. SCN-KJ]